MKNIITEKLERIYEQGKTKIYEVMFGQKFMAGYLEFDHSSNSSDGTPVFNYLMKPLGYAQNSDGKKAKGDLTIWYYCKGEKAGEISYENFITKKKIEVSWGLFSDRSSPDKVKKIIDAMYNDKIFTNVQYKTLSKAIDEARKMEDMYDIGNYLVPPDNNPNKKIDQKAPKTITYNRVWDYYKLVKEDMIRWTENRDIYLSGINDRALEWYVKGVGMKKMLDEHMIGSYKVYQAFIDIGYDEKKYNDNIACIRFYSKDVHQSSKPIKILLDGGILSGGLKKYINGYEILFEDKYYAALYLVMKLKSKMHVREMIEFLGKHLNKHFKQSNKELINQWGGVSDFKYNDTTIEIESGKIPVKYSLASVDGKIIHTYGENKTNILDFIGGK